jgi:hypothetical protein
MLEDDDPEDLLRSIHDFTDQWIIEEEVALPVPTSYAHTQFHPMMTPREEEQMILRLANNFLSNGPHPFVGMTPFVGKGIYAIYYQGDFPAYSGIKSPGSTCPIYIGKATRQVGEVAISSRLMEHSSTLSLTNLGLENFTFRFICIQANWITFAEDNLIKMFHPTWNIYLRGFGEKAGDLQTSRDKSQQVASFDWVHPGRETKARQPRDDYKTMMKLRLGVTNSRRAYNKAMSKLASFRDSNVDPGAVTDVLDACPRGLAAE